MRYVCTFLIWWAHFAIFSKLAKTWSWMQLEAISNPAWHPVVFAAWWLQPGMSGVLIKLLYSKPYIFLHMSGHRLLVLRPVSLLINLHYLLLPYSICKCTRLSSWKSLQVTVGQKLQIIMFCKLIHVLLGFSKSKLTQGAAWAMIPMK